MVRTTIGIVTGGARIPRWQAFALERIATLDFVDIKSVYFLDSGQNNREDYPAFATLSWPLRVLVKLDRLVFRSWCTPDSYSDQDIRDLDFLPDPKVVSAERSDSRRTLAVDEQDELQPECVDVLIDLGAWLDPKHAIAARFGIWRIVHHPFREPAEVLPGLWECLDQYPVMGSRVEIIEHPDNSPVVAHTLLSTPHYASPSVNRNYLSWTSSTLLARELAKLHELGAQEYVEARRPSALAEYADAGPTDRGHTFFGSVACCLRYLSNNVRMYIARKLNWEQWHLLFTLDPSGNADVRDYQAIEPPEDEFWADPHVIKKDEIYYVFIEVYPNQAKRGHLSVLQIDENGNVSEPVKILEKGYHLSYPMIVEYGNDIYMLPETKGNNTIEIYRCVEFPHRWEPMMVLMEDILATDATPFEHDGKWWLFATVVDSKYSQCREELHLFYADELLTKKWTPHPLNPIVSDVRSARPAGKMYRQGGKIIRPSQDCSYRYGYGLVFNEVIKLTTKEYEENRVSEITPTWASDVLGVHSYSRDSSLTVIDALRLRRRSSVGPKA